MSLASSSQFLAFVLSYPIAVSDSWRLPAHCEANEQRRQGVFEEGQLHRPTLQSSEPMQ
jgi:hypothetical protein